MGRDEDQYLRTKLRIVGNLKKGKNLKEAMEELTRAMEDFPHEPLLTIELADCLRLDGKLEEAKTLVLDALKKVPTNMNAHKVMGEIYLDKREYGNALEHFEAASRIKRTGYVTSRVIKTLIGLERFDEARDLIREELIENPANVIILRYRAQILEREGEYQEAANVYQRIHDLAPGDAFIYKELLRLRSKNREPAEVEREMKAMMKVSTAANNPHLHSEIGLNLKRAGKYGEAIAEFEKALALSPNNSFILSHLGYCYAKLDMPSKVVETLAGPFTEEPKDFYIRSSLVAAVKKGGHWEEFKRVLKKAIERHPGEKSLWGLLKKTEKELEKREG
ncbi:MAG: tetratricopeptide repeat protein [Syntrophales bacterium]|nr:tetratricopeptide repeat protein [Syntrophales bacterium]